MDPIFFYRNPEPMPATPDGPPDETSGETGAELATGGLESLKIAIQPNVSVQGWPTDAGSNALAGYIAPEDATVVQRIQEAGAYLYGSTHMSEFGFGLFKSKAGRALQEKAVMAELVLDFMGESRLAALRAGVCGFKPSYGLVSRHGLVSLIPSMECCGLLSPAVKNIRLILPTIAGQDDRDFSLSEEPIPDFAAMPPDPRSISVGVIGEAKAIVSPQELYVFESSVDALKDLGFTVREVSFPDFSLFTPVHEIVGSVEASSATGRYDSVRYGRRAPGARNWNEMYLRSRGAAFGSVLKSYLLQGAYFQFERYQAFEDACRLRARLVKGMEVLGAQTDFLLLPIGSAGPRPQAGGSADKPLPPADMYQEFTATLPANVTGWPALCLPFSCSSGQVGLQFMGPRLSDAPLLALGELILSNLGDD